jgi:sterol desaturase/sphingolipid hydroxylase (fatty acid hydroxylase superfamily)
MTDKSNEELGRRIVRWGLYPLSWLVLLVGFHLIWTTATSPRTIWGVCVGVLFLLYAFIEWRFPFEQRWSMSWSSFWADLKFLALNGVTIGLVSAGLALMTISISQEGNGPATHWPPALQLLICLLIFEAINYSIHRAMHDLKGRFGRVLWAVHAAHHLPPRLYLVMHAVFHPINGLLVQIIAIMIPIWWMGYQQNVVVMFLMINGMHGLLSHFNVDVRMGWFSYVFIGTETHRYHHSADVNEAKNFGATLAIFDQLFGTFVYRPGIAPQELGVDEKSGLPDYQRTVEVLLLPFKQR